MKNKLTLLLSFTLVMVLSSCATFDNLAKLPVENLSVEPEFETADFYNSKMLAITIFDPDSSYDVFRYGDSNLIAYNKLFAKSMKAKRPLIGLITQDELSNKMSNRDWVTISTRIARKTIADPADIKILATLSGANYVAIAKNRGLSSGSEVVSNFPNTSLVEYKNAMATFTIYDAQTGKNIWFGNFDHESNNTFGTPSWQYMMGHMYESFVLLLPSTSK